MPSASRLYQDTSLPPRDSHPLSPVPTVLWLSLKDMRIGQRCRNHSNPKSCRTGCRYPTTSVLDSFANVCQDEPLIELTATVSSLHDPQVPDAFATES